MATPAPGTIPALPQYQPGALALTGQEIFELASSPTATAAISAWIYLTDLVGKAPSVIPSQTPTVNDLITFYRKSTGLPASCAIGNLGIPAGNLPIAGNTGQILAKNSAVNFDDAWYNLSTFIATGTGITTAGTTTVIVGLSDHGVGSTQLGTNVVQNLNLRQGSPLSVVGVAGAATANVADVIASGGNLFLQSNAGGTGILFTTFATGSLPGPFQVASFTTNRVLIGNGTSAIQVSGVATAALPLVGAGTASPPSFAVLTVPGGGTGTTTLTAFGVLFGNGTSVIGITAAGNTGLALQSNGPTSAPSFAVLTVPGGGVGTSSLTANGVVYGNGSSAVGISAAGATALALVSNGPLVGPSFAVLSVPGGGINTTTLTQNGIVFGNGTSTVGITAQGAVNTYLSGNGAGAPTFTTAVSNIVAGFGLQGGPISTTGTIAISTSAPPAGLVTPINLGLTAATAAGVLTVSLVQANLATATLTSPILIPFRDATLVSGDVLWRAITTSLTYSTFATGATFGSANGTAFGLYLVLFDTGATPSPALINCSSGTSGGVSIYPLNEATLQSSSQVNSTATSLGTFYTNQGTTVASRPFRIVGVMDYASGLATAGTYTSTPTTLQVFGPGSLKPGEIVQTQVFFTTAVFTAATTNFSTTPVSNTITPTRASNLVKVTVNGSMGYVTGASAGRIELLRGALQIGPIISGAAGTTSGVSNPAGLSWIDAPGAAANTTYAVALASPAGSAQFPCTNNGASGAMIVLEELQG